MLPTPEGEWKEASPLTLCATKDHFDLFSPEAELTMAILSDRLISYMMCLNPHLRCISYPNRGSQQSSARLGEEDFQRLYAYSRMRRTPELSWSVWLGTGVWVIFLPRCGVVGPKTSPHPE